jgi:protein-tyrosine phosphatase
VQVERTHARRLALEGAANFRDLGGYATRDGRFVSWGRIFRSDVLADVSDADLRVLDGLGLRTICDLRSDPERAQKPNRPAVGIAANVHQIGFMPHEGDELLAAARAGVIAPAQIETRVREIYRRFVTDQAAHFAKLLELLQTEALPMLIHCTSGRDRTGFASAVVLMALGVERAAIAEDYLLSNHYRRDLTFQIGGPVDDSVMTALTNAHPGYLAAAFDAIDTGWGSEEGYLREALGLSAAGQQLLHDRLLGEKAA